MQSQQRPWSTLRGALKPGDLLELNQFGQRDQALICTCQQVLDTEHPEKGGVTLETRQLDKSFSWKRLIAEGYLPAIFPALGGRRPSDWKGDLSGASWHHPGHRAFSNFYDFYDLLYSFSRAAITEHCRLGVLNNRFFFFFFYDSRWLEDWDQTVRRADLSLWFIEHQLLPESSHGLPRVCVLISFIRTIITLN